MPSALSAILIVTSTALGDIPADELEAAFWDCEYLAIRGYLDLDIGAACSEIYEQLKAEKFGGDFERLLLWWREHKESELSSRMLLEQLRRNQ